ncbi:MAG: lysophospholipase [Candidatus Gastranaerophilales bacterium]|nr:lysophospholipase [Candidatus Gastranaerophilales bacterium]
MNIRKFIIILILFAFIFIPFASNTIAKEKKKKTVRTVEIQTKDEMILTGTLTMPESATVNAKVPLVILLHSLGSNRLTYTTLSQNLKAKNIAVLALDLRGHYQSTTKLSGKKSYWQNYSNKTFAKYPDDIITSIDYIRNNHVAIDVNRIGILGADVSANAAVITANKRKKQVKAIALISPSMSFKGLAPAQALLSYGNHPIYIIVAKNDVKHYKDGQLLAKYASGKVNFVTTQKGGTGDNILKANPNLNVALADWFKNNL